MTAPRDVALGMAVDSYRIFDTTELAQEAALPTCR
jgi:hypothetical protein